MKDTTIKQLNNWVGIGDSSGEWQALTKHSLLILVGVTGVGKTTTVNAIKAAGLTCTLLPNRRALTDQLIIPQMQTAADRPIKPVTDRVQRFAYTAQYREKYVGGMAHALSKLAIQKNRIPTERLIFDGIRGVNEVTAAANLFPNAYFLILEAPLVVRVKRLLGRGDAFDHVSGVTQIASNTLTDLAPDAIGLFTTTESNELSHLVSEGIVTASDLQAKLKIVLTERQHYDPDGARDALLACAPQRVILGDTVQLSPNQIAKLVTQKWQL